MPKIKTITELAGLERGNRKFVLCHGIWDLLHPGHIRHLEVAKQEGDILVVTVTPDKYVNKGPGRPVFNQNLRAESVASLQCVDYVAINEWPTAIETIKKLKPDIYAKGSDYAKRDDDLTGQIYNEEEAVKSVGGRIHFTNEINFSSTGLINQFLSPYPKEVQEFLNKFKEKYKAEDIIAQLKALKGVKVLIVGEAIIDEYCYCQGLGKIPKDNIIGAKYLDKERFAGGTLAAANHIAGFCDDVELVTFLGKNDNYGEFIINHLRPNIKIKFFYCDAPTIVKCRFIEPPFLSKMFELAYIQDELPESLHEEVNNYLARNVKNYDVVLSLDYGHGLIDAQAVEILAKKSKFLAANTQTNSANIGFNLITKYPRADYICLDEPELRLACRDKFGDIRSLVTKISRKLNCSKISITRGHHGSLNYSGDFFETPAFSTVVVDRMGAGDAYFSITTPCVAENYPMDMVGFIGNAVGALDVQIIGNREPIDPVSLFKFVTTLLK